MRSILGAIGAPVAAAPSRSLRHELVTRGRRHAAGWGRVQPGPPGPGRERTPNSAHVEVCRHERDRAGGRLRSLTFHRRDPPEGGRRGRSMTATIKNRPRSTRYKKPKTGEDT